MSDYERIIIVGGGIAALSAAERLREHGFGGELVIVGDEPHRAYNRTPLSKELLTGVRQPDELTVTAHTDVDAIWRTHTAARGLDLGARALLLPGGERLGFDGLVIATGVEARHLPGSPMHSPRVHTLRTLADARAIDTAFTRGRHLTIIGGGFIGCELASTAVERAVRVSIVEPGPTLLGASLGPELGAHITELHRRHGIDVHLGTTVAEGDLSGRRVSLTLSNGETIGTDEVVIAVGTAPRTDWLTGTGLDISNGVLCAPTCHVLGPDGQPLHGIVAAGDVARWPNLRIDSEARRVEHWINAIEMGQAAATALLAGPHTAQPFTAVPRFWSHQHGVRIQSVGLPALGARTQLLDGDPRRGSFVTGYLRPDPRSGGDTLIGAMAIDAPRTLLDYRDVIGQAFTAPAAA